MLGVEPTLGRFFDPALDLPGGAPVVVVSELFWRTRLRGDPHVIGSALRVNGRRATIVGVGPKDFLGIFGISPLQIFVPVTVDPAIAPELADDALHRTENPVFLVVMRLTPGISMAAVEAALDTQAQRLDEQAGKVEPDQDKTRRRVRLMSAGTMVPVPDEVRGAVVAVYVMLMRLILALTCASLAGLILARGNARGKEIAVRLSLGAGRFRLIRQLLTESFILAVAGGVTGLAMAYGPVRFLAQAMADSTPLVTENILNPDLRVVLVTFVAATLASVGCGLVPALATTRPDLVTALKGASGMRRSRYRRLGLRNLFVVGQVASAMALVLVMGFLIMGLKGNVNRDAGFRIEGVYLFKLDPARDGLSPDESMATFTRLPEQLARLSGVEGVTFSDQPPLGLVMVNNSVSVPAASADPDAQTEVHRVALQRVGPRFFATLGVPLSRGEEFGDRELNSDPAPDAVLPVVINHTAVRTLFGDADPLGRRIQQEDRSYQVVGVVDYGRPPPFQNRPAPALFLPLSQPNFRRGSVLGTSVVLRVRSAFDVAAVQRELESIDSRLTMFEARSLQESQDEFNQSAQYSASLNIGIGIFALILACVGLAGVTAQAVERRRKEIGIRMAIGAKAGQVIRLVMKEAAVMVLVSAGLGFAGAYALARVMSSMVAEFVRIIDASAGDPLLTIGVPSLLICLAMIACYLPARRSASINPLIALREE